MDNSFYKRHGNPLVNVIFTGGFATGKSTLINTIIGRNVLMTSSKPHGSAIVTMRFGMPQERITAEYTANKYDIPYEYNSPLSNFVCGYHNIEQIHLDLTDEVFGNLAQFIIIPPDIDFNGQTESLVLDYEKNADATVFVINALQPLHLEERDRIATKYRNSCNAFFVVNGIDRIDENERADLIKYVVDYLSPLFKNKSGETDRELMRKRVFFVSGYAANCVRTGRPFTILMGSQEVQVPITLVETGLTEFEKALLEFILSR